VKKNLSLNISLRMDPINKKVDNLSTNSATPGIESRRATFLVSGLATTLRLTLASELSIIV
jgi:hypothetical protein